MRKILNLVVAAALLAGVSLAQDSVQTNSPSAPQNSAVRIAPDTILRVELTKSVDAKKAKVGDEVTGKTMDEFLSGNNDVVAPKGSRVVAHVAEVSVREGGSASAMGIAFDKLVLKNGPDVPLKASIQAIGRPQPIPAAVNQPMSESSGGAARPMSGPGRDMGYPGAMQNQVAAAADSVVNQPGSATRELSRSTQGVVGIPGLSLNSGSAGDSILSSPKQNVKLDSGTQMILRVIP